MKILSIGNSFSQDAQRYLSKIAIKEGERIKNINLYIGGCSLRTHYLNMLDGRDDYTLEFLGESTGVKVSIDRVLRSDDWDVITLQQVSTQSAKFESYTPYIEELADYVRTFCPKAKIYIHETWAYENGCARLSALGFESDEDMYAGLKDAYAKAKEKIEAYGIIPSGTAMIEASKRGLSHLHRDTFHASLGAGRYILGLTWYKALFGKDITENDFSDFDEPITEEERRIIIESVNAAFKCD